MNSLRLLRRFGIAIRMRRDVLGITQMELAKLSGCSLQHLGNVERGTANTSFIMIYKICDALQTTPQELMPKPK